MPHLDTLRAYLAAYNARDLAAVLNHLREDCAVFLNNHEIARGRDNLRPMYEMDFAGGKEVVTILGTPEVTESAVRVQLKNPNMEPNGKVVDVTYHFDENGMMVRHDIHGVVDCE